MSFPHSLWVQFPQSEMLQGLLLIHTGRSDSDVLCRLATTEYLKNTFNHLGQVDLVSIAEDDTSRHNENWALITFRHESSLTRVLQGVHGGSFLTPTGDVLKVEQATKAKVIEFHNKTVARKHHWNDIGGIADATKAVEQENEREFVIRETPQELAARLSRSFKTHASNVESSEFV